MLFYNIEITCMGAATVVGTRRRRQSLLESPRDNKKRDKKSESRSMPPLDYYTVALTVWLSPLSNRMLRYIGCGAAHEL